MFEMVFGCVNYFESAIVFGFAFEIGSVLESSLGTEFGKTSGCVLYSEWAKQFGCWSPPGSNFESHFATD